MILDNTNRMYPSLQPQSYLRSRGYMNGLGETPEPSTFFGMTVSEIQQIVSGLNSQQLFQMNLQRAQQGLPALNAAQYAPSMNFGLNPDTQKLVMFGAIGLLAVLLLNSAK